MSTDKPAKRTYKKTGKTKALAAAARAAEDAAKPKTGRPVEVTEAVLNEVLRRISEGRTLEAVCREDPDMPSATTVRDRAASDAVFSSALARARRHLAAETASKLLEIADGSCNDWVEHSYAGKTTLRPDREAIDRSKVRIDVRKYLLSIWDKHTYSPDAIKLAPNEGDAAELIKSDATVICPDLPGPKKPVL